MSAVIAKGTRVFIPTPLRQFTNQNPELVVEGKTVGEVLQKLAAGNPPLQRHIFSDDGKIRGFVNVYLN
ncbi:MAG: molybdopterin synthase sulfur carrier subunit, partial [bacterium]